jgi:hypothetical protein
MSYTDLHEVKAWLDGKENYYNASNSGDQKHLIEGIESLCRRTDGDSEELNKIGNKLLKRKSNMIAHMLVMCVFLSKRHRVAAYKALANRRKSDIPEGINRSDLYVYYEDFNLISIKKRLKLFNMLLTHKHTKWKLTIDEVGKLLFPISIENPEWAEKTRSRISRIIKREERNLNQEELRNILVDHCLEKINNGEIDLRELLLNGINGYKYRGINTLENEAYKWGLLK